MLFNFWNQINAKILYLTLLISVVAVGTMQKQYYSQQISSTNDTNYLQQEQELKILLETQKTIPTFGFNNILANFNYLKFIEYYGDEEAREITGYSLIPDFFDILVKQDNRFISAYLTLSTANSLFAGQPKQTIDYMNNVLDSISPSMENFPFLIWVYKATDEILFLGDLEAARQSYLQAAQWAEKRNDEIGKTMAKRYRKTATFLASNPDSTDTQISAWLTILSKTKDKKTRQYVIEELKNIGAEIIIDESGKINVKAHKST